MGRQGLGLTFVKGCLWCIASAGSSLLESVETSGAVIFNFVYVDSISNPNTGFFDPVQGPARRAALEGVAADIGSKIGQNATVDVRLAPSELDGTGFAGLAAQVFLNAAAPAAGIFDGEVYRRIIFGTPDMTPLTDGVITFDFGYPMTLSGAPTPGVTYFPDLVRHEMTHMLGYGSLMRANGRGRNDTQPDVYSRFDTFLEAPGGATLINAAGAMLLSSTDFAQAYAIGVSFDGPHTRAANGGNPLLLYFSDTTHSRNPADVMYVSPAVGFARDAWSPRDIGVLRDLGYIIVPEPQDLAFVVCASAWLWIRRRRVDQGRSRSSDC